MTMTMMMMMIITMSMRLILSLSISLTLTLGAAQAYEPTPPINLTSMTDQYTRGQYQMAQYIGAQLLRQEPSNLAVHYLLGNCYVKFGQLDKAKAEYNFCARVGQGSQLGTVAQQALNNIVTIQNAPQSTSANTASASAGPPADASAGTAGTAEAPAASLIETAPPAASPAPDKLDLQTLEYKERLLKAGADLIAANKLKLERQIESIHNQTELAIHGTSADQTSSTFMDSGRLVREAAERIRMLQENNASEERKITANCQAQVDAIGSQKGNLTSQAQVGNSEVRLEPKGTGLFVRNFINYHGEVPLPPPPPELRAKALKLNPDPPKKQKAVP
jgi:hypothetical protein